MLLHKTVVHDSRVRREAATLAAAGHDVVVLELAAVDTPVLDGFRRRSVAPPAWVKRVLPFALYRLVFFAWFVRGIVAERPDVIHAHDAAMLLPAVAGRRLTGARLVYDSHELATSVPYREKTWAAFVAGIERIGIPRAAAVITVSDGIAARMSERYGLRETPVVVRNVCDLSPTGAPAGLRERLGIDRDTPLVLHQGAPAPSRGCDTLVRAMAGVPDAQLVFLGDSDMGYEAPLRALIAELRLENRVTLLPSVPLERLLDHTAEADVGVTLLQDTCENHRLALPNKLFEYLAAGIPVVGADLPEVRALVTGREIGWVADPADPEDLARALRAAVAARRDDRLRARVAAAHAELRWPVERQRLTGLYDALSAA
jgi:glycosyltransferase involved in cell wall biosynthesis